jgi:hypothetical protein
VRKPNPVLLDILYRASAYPFDDFGVEDGQNVGVWVIPHTYTNMPLVLCLRNNGTYVDPLIQELQRFAAKSQRDHGRFAQQSRTLMGRKEASAGEQVWTYEIMYLCTDTLGRVTQREIKPRTYEEVVLMCASYVFIPWFNPPPEYYPNDPGEQRTFFFSGQHLPMLTHDVDTGDPLDLDTPFPWARTDDGGLEALDEEFELPDDEEEDEDEDEEEDGEDEEDEEDESDPSEDNEEKPDNVQDFADDFERISPMAD